MTRMWQATWVSCVVAASSQFNYQPFLQGGGGGHLDQGNQSTQEVGQVSGQQDDWHQYVQSGSPSNGQQYDWHGYVQGGGTANGQYDWHQYVHGGAASNRQQFDWHQYVHRANVSNRQQFDWHQFVPHGNFSSNLSDWQQYADQYRQNHSHQWDYYVHLYGNSSHVQYNNAWGNVRLNTIHSWQNNATDAHNANQLCSFFAHQVAVLRVFTPAPFQHWGDDNLHDTVLTNLVRLNRESNGSIVVANCSGELFSLDDGNFQYDGPRDASDCATEDELQVWREHAQTQIHNFAPISFRNMSLADVDDEYQQNLDRINDVAAPVVVAPAAAPAPITANATANATQSAFLAESPMKQTAALVLLMFALIAGVVVSAVAVGSRRHRGPSASEPLLDSTAYMVLP